MVNIRGKHQFVSLNRCQNPPRIAGPEIALHGTTPRRACTSYWHPYKLPPCPSFYDSRPLACLSPYKYLLRPRPRHPCLGTLCRCGAAAQSSYMFSMRTSRIVLWPCHVQHGPPPSAHWPSASRHCRHFHWNADGIFFIHELKLFRQSQGFTQKWEHKAAGCASTPTYLIRSKTFLLHNGITYCSFSRQIETKFLNWQ